jgi:hypothetical protein
MWPPIIERNYCGVVINDEDHSNPSTLIDLISFDELLMLNRWIADRSKPKILRHKRTSDK